MQRRTWWRRNEINKTSLIAGQRAASHMVAQKRGGSLLCMSSVHGVRPCAEWTVYGSCKARSPTHDTFHFLHPKRHGLPPRYPSLHCLHPKRVCLWGVCFVLLHTHIHTHRHKHTHTSTHTQAPCPSVHLYTCSRLQTFAGGAGEDGARHGRGPCWPWHHRQLHSTWCHCQRPTSS